MEGLFNFIKESRTKSSMVHIPGKLDWVFKSNEYGINEKVSCKGWSKIFNDEVIAFWSPESDWIPYLYISGLNRGETNWALVSNDASITSPETFLKVALDRWDDYLAEGATVPELEKIDVPDVVRRWV